jgi:hypothetical protein
MSPALKSDVHNHVSHNTRRPVLPFGFMSQPDATGYSEDESDREVDGRVLSEIGLEPIPSSSPLPDAVAAMFPQNRDSVSSSVVRKPSV